MSCSIPNFTSIYIDYLPLIVTVLQRYRPQILAAAQQYSANMDLKEAVASLQADIAPTCDFIADLKLISIKTVPQIRAYALQAVHKLVDFQFARISLYELWFVDTVWGKASLPAVAVEVLKMWRGQMYQALIRMFSQDYLCPDYRGLKLDKSAAG